MLSPWTILTALVGTVIVYAGLLKIIEHRIRESLRLYGYPIDKLAISHRFPRSATWSVGSLLLRYPVFEHNGQWRAYHINSKGERLLIDPDKLKKRLDDTSIEATRLDTDLVASSLD